MDISQQPNRAPPTNQKVNRLESVCALYTMLKAVTNAQVLLSSPLVTSTGHITAAPGPHVTLEAPTKSAIAAGCFCGVGQRRREVFEDKDVCDVRIGCHLVQVVLCPRTRAIIRPIF